MIVVTTQNLSVSLPDRFLEGEPIDAEAAAELQRVLTSRIRAHIQAWLASGVDAAVAQREAEILARELPFTAESAPPVDPVTAEALRLARDLVLQRLTVHGLTFDEAVIAAHSSALAQHPDLRKRAEAIVSMRTTAALKSLKSR